MAEDAAAAGADAPAAAAPPVPALATGLHPLDPRRRIDRSVHTSADMPELPALVLLTHCAMKSVQWSVLGLPVWPLYSLARGRTLASTFRPVFLALPAFGLAGTAAALAYKAKDMDDAGVDDRAFRISKSVSQNAVDRRSLIGGAAGAALGAVAGPGGLSGVLATASFGVALGVAYHSMLMPEVQAGIQRMTAGTRNQAELALRSRQARVASTKKGTCKSSSAAMIDLNQRGGAPFSHANGLEVGLRDEVDDGIRNRLRNDVVITHEHSCGVELHEGVTNRIGFDVAVHDRISHCVGRGNAFPINVKVSRRIPLGIRINNHVTDGDDNPIAIGTTVCRVTLAHGNAYSNDVVNKVCNNITIAIVVAIISFAVGLSISDGDAVNERLGLSSGDSQLRRERVADAVGHGL